MRQVAPSRASGPDLLRAIAILLVMLWHVPKAATPVALAGVKPFGWIGVDLFFVLSGYLIGTQILNETARRGRPDLAGFYLQRSFRILPAYWLVLTLYELFPILREADGMPSLWRFLTFTMNFDLEFRLTGTFSQAWSLCVEEHFYLLLPLLLLGGLRSARSTAVLATAVIVAGMLLRFAIWQAELGEGVVDARGGQLRGAFLESIYYPTYARLDGLVFGVLLAAIRVFRLGLWRRYVDAKRAITAGVVLLAAALLLLAYRGGLPREAHLPALSLQGAVLAYPLLALAFALILSGLLDAEDWLKRWPIPGATSVALISYSLYLTHKAVMHVDELMIGRESLRGLPGFLVYFASSIAVAGLLWFTIERPFLSLRGRVVAWRSPSLDAGVRSKSTNAGCAPSI